MVRGHSPSSKSATDARSSLRFRLLSTKAKVRDSPIDSCTPDWIAWSSASHALRLTAAWTLLKHLIVTAWYIKTAPLILRLCKIRMGAKEASVYTMTCEPISRCVCLSSVGKCCPTWLSVAMPAVRYSAEGPCGSVPTTQLDQALVDTSNGLLA